MSWHVLRSPYACKLRKFAGNTIHTVFTDFPFTHPCSIHTAAVLQGIGPEVDATCSLSAHSRFKHPLQSCTTPKHSLTLPAMPPGRCYYVIMVSKHNRTSCSAHLNVTNQRAIICTAGPHPPQDNQTNFDRLHTHKHTHTNLSLNRLQPACLSTPLPIFITIPRVFRKCKYFYRCLRIVLMLYLNPLKLTTQPDPKGFFSSVFFFHKHRCCPSVSAPAWWPSPGWLPAGWAVSHICGGCQGPYLSTPETPYPCLSLIHPSPLNLSALQESQ